MECNQDWVVDSTYLQSFNKKIIQNRIPLTGSIDLTERCNLRCAHCYVSGDKTEAGMETGRLIEIIDEIADAGCLYLLLTGGEPFLRDDFRIIYTHAKERGLLVTVFSNGTLIDDDSISLFKELPPSGIEISLYGATKETYESVTGIPGSYTACMNGIYQLHEASMPLRLKTIVMTLNRHEFSDIENLAKQLNAGFRFDAAIFPRLDGDCTPLKLRIPAKDAVALEFCVDSRANAWETLWLKDLTPESDDYLYGCGAGVATFHITATGYLQPCMMASGVRYDLTNGSFDFGWNSVIPEVRKIKAGPDNPCRGCSLKVLCGYCPPFFSLETGEKNTRSRYLCEIGEYRYRNLAGREKVNERNQYR